MKKTLIPYMKYTNDPLAQNDLVGSKKKTNLPRLF